MKKNKSSGYLAEKKKYVHGVTGDRSRQENAYGDNAPICINTGCLMRKKAQCFGFEGCPGFKGR